MYQYEIPDMSCSHCVATVTKAIKGIDASAIADVDLIKRIAIIETKADPAVISAALGEAGYPSTFQTLELSATVGPNPPS